MSVNKIDAFLNLAGPPPLQKLQITFQRHIILAAAPETFQVKTTGLPDDSKTPILGHSRQLWWLSTALGDTC
jgi:hypothetical protein